MRKYLIVVLILISSLAFGCKKDEEDETKVEEKYEYIPIEAIHTITEEDISSYLVFNSKPELDDGNTIVLTSMTYYSIFRKEDRTNRLYQFYQVDYQESNGNKDYYYHKFDAIDGVSRIYSQNFAPYFNYNSEISNFKVLVKYSFDLNGQSYQKEIKYLENILSFESVDKYELINSDMFSLIKESKLEEEFNRYKLNIKMPIERNGHVDVQTWIECEETIYPFLGLYHYDLSNGDYISVGDEMINKAYNIKNMYCKIVEYSNDNKVTTSYQKIDLLN